MAHFEQPLQLHHFSVEVDYGFEAYDIFVPPPEQTEGMVPEAQHASPLVLHESTAKSAVHPVVEMTAYACIPAVTVACHGTPEQSSAETSALLLSHIPQLLNYRRVWESILIFSYKSHTLTQNVRMWIHHL